MFFKITSQTIKKNLVYLSLNNHLLMLVTIYKNPKTILNFKIQTQNLQKTIQNVNFFYLVTTSSPTDTDVILSHNSPVLKRALNTQGTAKAKHLVFKINFINFKLVRCQSFFFRRHTRRQYQVEYNHHKQCVLVAVYLVIIELKSTQN